MESEKEKKNYDEVDKYYEKYHPEEQVTVDHLNSKMDKYYPEFGLAGVKFILHPEEDKFKKYDCELIWTNQVTMAIVVLAKIELEFGADQARHKEPIKNWDYNIPRVHWEYLSLLKRKNYDENFECFFKVSSTYHSAFAIDTRESFVSKNKDFDGEMKKDSTNDKFNTNRGRIGFLWETVDKNSFSCIREKNMGNLKIIKNGNICVMEDNLWKEIIAFFANKYFTDELKKEIRIQHDLIHKKNEQI